jgi:glycosyltransferase involved in cell wall biosynthesis
MKKPFKIAMVAACPFPYQRGTPIRIFRLAESLALRGNEVSVITYHLGNDVTDAPFRTYRIPDIIKYRNFTPGPSYQKLLLLDPLLAIKLFNFLKHHEVDLIHAHHYEGLFISFLISKWTGHPLVYDAHTLLESELPFYGLGLSKTMKIKIGNYLDRRLPKYADHIITPTERIKSKLIEIANVEPQKITVVTNGLENEHFNVKREDLKPLKDGIKTLLFAGNLAPYQGIDLLLRSFREILNIRQDVRLLIISDSSFDDYQPLANTLKIKRYIDVIGFDFLSLPKYLACADVTLNPRTDCDGIPQKLLNYMAAGKPIVSFEGSAVNMEHERTGLIVENGNIPAFAKAVLHLLENPELARKLGESAKDFVTPKFSWDKSAEKLEAVYEQVIMDQSKSAGEPLR